MLMRTVCTQTGDTTVDQLREMVEARIGSKKKPAQGPPGGGGETPRSMATFSNGSTQGGSPLKKAAAGAAAERAVVAVAAAAAEKAAPTITLAEIGLPEAMPARQPLVQQFVRVVNI